jgi:hypothetical protein
MKIYLTSFSLFALTVGIILFSAVFLSDVGMTYDLYKTWMSILISFTTLIANMAMSYYFAKNESPQSTLLQDALHESPSNGLALNGRSLDDRQS